MMSLFDNDKLKPKAVIMPLLSTKDADTVPYKDWLRSCGINDVLTEDDVVREVEKRVLKAASRFGKRTPEKQLKQAFPTLHILRQLDVRQADGRSSDIGMVRLGYDNRVIYSHSGTMVISEHAVRRYWAHTGQRPDIEDWLCRYPYWYDVHQRPSELYAQDGLLLGELFRSDNALQGWNIDTKEDVKSAGLAFRIKTIIPTGLLNENQIARWYKLKKEWENNA